MQDTQHNTKLVIGTIAAVIVIFGGLTWALISLPSESPATTTPNSFTFDDANAPFKGKEDAKVVVQIYSDLQCPVCRAAEPAMNEAIKQYGDRVKFVWNDFPLMSLHPNARNAANAARCARAQGKFWEYTEKLFSEQMTWQGLKDPADAYLGYANELGLSGDGFKSCYEKKEFDSVVMTDVAEATKNGFRGTPTIVIAGKVYNAISIDQWRKALDEALAQP